MLAGEMVLLEFAGLTSLALLATPSPLSCSLLVLAAVIMFGMAMCLPVSTMTALAPLVSAAGLYASTRGAAKFRKGAFGSSANARFYDGTQASLCTVAAISAIGARLLGTRYGRLLWADSKA